MKCNKCGSEWKVSASMERKLKVCPFCNAQLIPMDNSAKEVCVCHEKDGSVIEGIKKDGVWDGPYKKTLTDGSYFEGTYVKGETYGELKYVCSRYTLTGFYKDGNWDGPYKKTLTDGSYFEGTYVKGETYGKLKYVCSRYTLTGFYKDGDWDGPYEKVFKDGSSYEGTYVKGKAYGKTIYRDKYGRMTIGMWRDGNWNGECKKIKKDRHMEGTKVDGKWDGKLDYCDERVFSAEWHDGNWNGNGTFRSECCDGIDKIIYSGLWKDGLLSGKDSKLKIIQNPRKAILYEGEFFLGKVCGKGFLYIITDGVKEPLDHGIWKDNVLDRPSKNNLVYDSESIISKAVDYIRKVTIEVNEYIAGWE